MFTDMLCQWRSAQNISRLFMMHPLFVSASCMIPSCKAMQGTARHCQAFDIIRAFCAFSVLVQVAYMGLTSLSGDAMKKHLTGFFKRGQCDATCTVVCLLFGIILLHT